MTVFLRSETPADPSLRYRPEIEVEEEVGESRLDFIVRIVVGVVPFVEKACWARLVLVRGSVVIGWRKRVIRHLTCECMRA